MTLCLHFKCVLRDETSDREWTETHAFRTRGVAWIEIHAAPVEANGQSVRPYASRGSLLRGGELGYNPRHAILGDFLRDIVGKGRQANRPSHTGVSIG